MPLSRKRLLIVEDEYLVAMDLAYAVEELGAEVSEIAGSLEKAMMAADRDIDGALIDVQLGEEKSFPVIEKLAAAQIPFILMTGYHVSILPENMHHYPRIMKPFSDRELKRVTKEVLLEV